MVTSFVQYLLVSQDLFLLRWHYLTSYSGQSDRAFIHQRLQVSYVALDSTGDQSLIIWFCSVYAFSNVHDVVSWIVTPRLLPSRLLTFFLIQSWGTKGSDKVEMDLGSAGGGKNAKAGEVDVAVPTEEKDINALYAAELKRLAEPAPVEVKTKSAAQKQEDYYKVRSIESVALDASLTYRA